MTISKFSSGILVILLLTFVGCEQPPEHHEKPHKVVVTTPVRRDVEVTQQYVCQIHSCRHIEVCALEDGYLEAIPVKEGQTVKEGDVLYKILPTLYQAKLDAEIAEAEVARIDFDNTKRLFEKKVVAQPEVALAEAKLNKAKAKVAEARAELNFATIKAPFDGIIDHQILQQGSLVAKGDKLTTMSDNSLMWVYFNVPEARYLEYKADKNKDNLKIELVLANGQKFSQIGKIGAIEADFNNETGNIAFRADFPNPEGLLRHGQTGTILISRVMKDALVIPQRATYEILAKRYVYVVANEPAKIETREQSGGGEEHGSAHEKLHEVKLVSGEKDAHKSGHEEEGEDEIGTQRGFAQQREIAVDTELDDVYLIKDGIGLEDKIVLEGVRQVRANDEVVYEYIEPQAALANLKFHAE